MSEQALLVLCTCPDGVTASKIATALVAERLAACVNRLPGVQSLFRWQGAVESQAEELLLVKTTAAAWPKLEARIRELHPYELPEVIGVPIAVGSGPSLQWITESTQP
jgi:periplasmic divalent cation tolerance protein